MKNLRRSSRVRESAAHGGVAADTFVRGSLVALILFAVLAAMPAQGQIQSCDAPMLTYSADDEPAVTLPLTITYPAHGAASVAGQGSNPSGVGYTVVVTQINAADEVDFGVDDSDTGEGVPWDDPSGDLTDGSVRSWAIDVGTRTGTGVPTYKITITFDAPVSGLKFAVTDLDHTVETALVNAFPVPSGGSVITLTDNLLSDPSTLPALASGAAHATNDAYVVDSTFVHAAGSGLYTVPTGGGTSSQNGTVLFAYGDSQSVQRVEITYTGEGTGIWIAGLVFNSCTTGRGIPAASHWGLAALALALLLLGTAVLVKRG